MCPPADFEGPERFQVAADVTMIGAKHRQHVHIRAARQSHVFARHRVVRN